MNKSTKFQSSPPPQSVSVLQPKASSPTLRLMISRFCAWCRVEAAPWRRAVSTLALGFLASFVALGFEGSIGKPVTPAITGDGGADALFNRWLDPPESDPTVEARSEATYSVTFRGSWTTAVTPGGLPGSAHFTRLVGGVHNAGVTFLRAGGRASPGVELMAELGGTSILANEVRAARPNALEVLLGGGNIGPAGASTIDNVTPHPPITPRVTLLTMIAPSPGLVRGGLRAAPPG